MGFVPIRARAGSYLYYKAKYISQNLKDFDNFFSSDEFRIILGLIQTL